MGEEIKPCPCGKTPTQLCLMDTGQGGKWAIAIGNCCDEWGVEFRTGYNPLDGDKCQTIAIEYWNDAPRSDNWISVEERLPEEGKEVLIYVRNYHVTIGRLYNSWMTSGGYNWHARERVTHWQPLPEPPK